MGIVVNSLKQAGWKTLNEVVKDVDFIPLLI